MHFWSPNKKPMGGGGKRKEKKRKKKKRKEGSKSKVWIMELVIFIWNYMVCMEFLSNCMVRRLLQT